MNITKIEIYSKSGKFDRTIQKARVYYEDGHDVKLDNIEDITMELAKFLQQEKMEIDDLINDKEKLPIIKYEELDILNPKAETKTKEEPKTEAPASEDAPKIEAPASGDAPKAEEEEKEKKKSWFSKLKKPLVCLGTVIVLTFVGSNLFQKGNDYSSKRTGTPKKTITQEFKDTPVEDNGSKYLENLQKYVQKDELYYNVQDYISGVNKNEGNLMNILNAISNECQANIEQFYQFIENGKTMSGDFNHIALQNMYDENDVNYGILEKFCALREKVIEKCYNNDKEGTLSALRNFYNYAIDFVYCDVPIRVNGRDVRFYDNDVHPFTRHAILTLTTLLMEINKIDYNAMIGNSVYPIDELRTFINSTHNSLVEIMYENVSSKSY